MTKQENYLYRLVKNALNHDQKLQHTMVIIKWVDNLKRALEARYYNRYVCVNNSNNAASLILLKGKDLNTCVEFLINLEISRIAYLIRYEPLRLLYTDVEKCRSVREVEWTLNYCLPNKLRELNQLEK